jgi:hypothetical protein
VAFEEKIIFLSLVGFNVISEFDFLASESLLEVKTSLTNLIRPLTIKIVPHVPLKHF